MSDVNPDTLAETMGSARSQKRNAFLDSKRVENKATKERIMESSSLVGHGDKKTRRERYRENCRQKMREEETGETSKTSSAMRTIADIQKHHVENLDQQQLQQPLADEIIQKDSGESRKGGLSGDVGLAKKDGSSTGMRKEQEAEGTKDKVPTAKDDGEGASQETRARTASFTAPCSGSPSPAQAPPTTTVNHQNPDSKQQSASDASLKNHAESPSDACEDLEGSRDPTQSHKSTTDHSTAEEGLRIRIKLHLDTKVNLEIKDVVGEDGQTAIEVLIAKNSGDGGTRSETRDSDSIPKSHNAESMETRHETSEGLHQDAKVTPIAPIQQAPQEQSGLMKKTPTDVREESELSTLNGSSWQQLSTVHTSEIQRFWGSSEDVMQIPQGIPNGDRLDSIFVPSGVSMKSQSEWSRDTTANPTTPSKRRGNGDDRESADDSDEKRAKTEDPEVSNLFDELDVLPSCPRCQCPFQNPISYFNHFADHHKMDHELTPCHHASCPESFRSERIFSHHINKVHCQAEISETFKPQRTSTPMRDTDEDIEEDIEETTSDWNPMLEAKAGGTQSKTKRRDNK